MVTIEVDDTISNIEKRLGKMKHKAPKVLCKSINDTAVWARSELAKEAQKSYTVKKGGFYKSMKIKKANYSSLESIISSQGETLELYKYKYSKGKKTTKAQVLRQGGLKTLEKSGIKAFVAQFTSGHKTIAQRVGESRLPIKIFYSNSIPTMIGSEKRVYGIVEPNIEDKLSEQVEKHIIKVLEGYE